MDFYVYLHKKKTTGEVFYVGKGSGKRAWSVRGRSKFWKSIVSKYGVDIEVYADNLQEWYAFELEQDLISLYGRRDLGDGALVNLNDGGYGGTCGYEHTVDHKEFMRERMTGTNHPCHDANVYTFYNFITEETVKCKRVELKERYPNVSTNSLFCGLKTSNGWLVMEHNTPRSIEEIKLNIIDKRIWTFYNKYSDEYLSTTQKEFRIKYPKANMGSLMTGKSSLGWINISMIEEDQLSIRLEAFKNSYKGNYSFISDKNRYHFYNIFTTSEFNGTRQEFKQSFGFDLDDLFLSTKKMNHCKGWCLYHNRHSKRIKDMTERHHFVNKDGDEFIGTRCEFKQKYGLDIKPIFGNTEKIQYMDWTLHCNKDIAFTKKTDLYTSTFIHDSGEVFHGTRSQFEDKYGINPKPLFRSNPPKRCKGWYLELACNNEDSVV